MNNSSTVIYCRVSDMYLHYRGNVWNSEQVGYPNTFPGWNSEQVNSLVGIPNSPAHHFFSKLKCPYLSNQTSDSHSVFFPGSVGPSCTCTYSPHVPHMHVATCTWPFLNACARTKFHQLTSSYFVVQKTYAPTFWVEVMFGIADIPKDIVM